LPLPPAHRIAPLLPTGLPGLFPPSTWSRSCGTLRSTSIRWSDSCLGLFLTVVAAQGAHRTSCRAFGRGRDDMSQGPQTRTCSDEELVGLVQGSGGHKRRDHAEILLRRYQDWIVRGCARIVRDPEDAADCAQEVLLKLYRLIETYRGKGSVAAWVHSIIRSVCLDALGRRHRDRSGVRSLPADLAELSAPGGGPVAVLASREKNQIVRASRRACSTFTSSRVGAWRGSPRSSTSTTTRGPGPISPGQSVS
jgi:RNA polymerase sigma factor (sigma-70 family)